ncbi:bile acid:sodium symporter family protein [Variovorax soli]|uniref:bile acid:sodium symporter family protein n=1 Tax=Variovorax soli TaxID=376815 RepID=UPI000837EC2F|nr:bile acid:sodium symporter family protein [Variovorax soli]
MLPVDEIRLNFNPASLVLLNAVLGFLMFGIALDTRVADFRRVARMPLAMAVGIAAQFIVLPAITFCLTLVLQPAPSIALGMILVACCPPGNISNILTHRAGGNVALSVSMTAISNLISIVVMPINFAFWGGIHPTASALLKTIALNPAEMVVHIITIIGAPFVLGIAVAHFLPGFTGKAKKPIRILSFLCLVGFIIGAIAGNWRYFMDYVGLVLLAVVLHDALAFATGYLCASATRLAEYDRRAVSFEVGIRNAGLGLVLIFGFFGGLGGMAVVAGVWGFWDIIAGLLLAGWWGRRPLPSTSSESGSSTAARSA